MLMDCVFNLVVLDLFLVLDRLLQAYQLFLIAHQQVSGHDRASKISLSVLLTLSQMGFFMYVKQLGWGKITPPE